ncbi:MAG TPA: methyltransferase domain-containing protein [Alphaproteobacteria bacterium]|jgi:ubiquinone/menaquinone biosynthesis C-methylase UbiE
MTDTANQQNRVAAQFGPQAEAYVTSAVHSQGEDLRQIGDWAAARKAQKGLGRALDMGCGGGHVAFAVAPYAGEVTAYDLSDGMLAAVAAAARERGLANVVTRQGAVETLPFPDASFDMVLSRYSAHHWRGFDAALAEARRVLKPGGLAVFADIFAPDDALCDTWLQGIELLRDPSHQRDYSQKEWRAALERAGFKPGQPTTSRLRLDYASWIARMKTPAVQADAIKALWAVAPSEVRDYLALEADGSFTIDSMIMEAWPA